MTVATSAASRAFPWQYQVAGIGLLAQSPLDHLPQCGEVTDGWRLLPRRGGAWPLPRRRVCLRQGRGHALFVGWPRLGAFWIQPRGRQLHYWLAPQASPEAFLDVLLGPMVSYLLLMEGYDPLHGSAVRVGRRAIGFLGPPGAGKSTLAAALLLAGYGLVADDLLTLVWQRQQPLVMPGYPEIRLWPGSGQRLLPEAFTQLPRVVPTASKRRLDPRDVAAGFVTTALPLRVLYDLHRSTRLRRPAIRALSPSAAFLALVRNLYNTALVTPDILTRQFRHLAQLSTRVPVRQLLLPQRWVEPTRLAEIIVADAQHVH